LILFSLWRRYFIIAFAIIIIFIDAISPLRLLFISPRFHCFISLLLFSFIIATFFACLLRDISPFSLLRHYFSFRCCDAFLSLSISAAAIAFAAMPLR